MRWRGLVRQDGRVHGDVIHLGQAHRWRWRSGIPLARVATDGPTVADTAREVLVRAGWVPR